MSSVINEDSIIQAVNQQVTGDLPDGDIVILSIRDGVYFGLNQVGGRIWKLIQRPISICGIHQALLDEYDVDPEDCYQEILSFISELYEHGLVVLNSEPVETH